MRFVLALSLLGLGATFVLAGAGGAGASPRSDTAAKRLQVVRADIDRYRRLAWSFERVTRERRAPTSYAYRRSTELTHLNRTLASWERTAYEARGHALGLLRRRTLEPLPQPPGLHAVLRKRIAFSRRLAVHLRRIVYPGRVSHRYAAARAGSAAETLRLWQERAAVAAVRVAGHARRLLDAADPLVGGFLCIHHVEGAWTANTGNGYYGGLQMDSRFMQTYGAEYLERWGTADQWPAWAQLAAAVRAYRAGRGFAPWPNSARVCGLLGIRSPG